MEKKKLTESERIAKVLLPQIQEMQRRTFFDKHLGISIVINPCMSAQIGVCVEYIEDNKDVDSLTYNEYFSFNPFYSTEENDAKFESLVAYVNEKAGK